MSVAHQLLQIVTRRSPTGKPTSDLWSLLEPPDVAEWWKKADRALEDVPHAVVGGVAAIRYMPPRQTKDVDFAVATADRQAAERALCYEHGYRTGEHLFDMQGHVIGRVYWDHRRNRVDVLWLPTRLRPLIAAAQRNRFEGMPTATLPWLTLLKLEAGRAQDAGDLVRMLGHQDAATLAAVRRLVRRLASPQDREDLDQYIELGRLEYGRTRRRK